MNLDSLPYSISQPRAFYFEPAGVGKSRLTLETTLGADL
jgi:hypothetical protein